MASIYREIPRSAHRPRIGKIIHPRDASEQRRARKRRNPRLDPRESRRAGRAIREAGTIRPSISALTRGFLIFPLIYRNLPPTRAPNAKRTRRPHNASAPLHNASSDRSSFNSQIRRGSARARGRRSARARYGSQLRFPANESPVRHEVNHEADSDWLEVPRSRKSFKVQREERERERERGRRTSPADD